MNAAAMPLTALLLTFVTIVFFAAFAAAEQVRYGDSEAERKIRRKRRDFYARVAWTFFAIAVAAWLVAIWTADFS